VATSTGLAYGTWQDENTGHKDGLLAHAHAHEEVEKLLVNETTYVHLGPRCAPDGLLLHAPCPQVRWRSHPKLSATSRVRESRLK